MGYIVYSRGMIVLFCTLLSLIPKLVFAKTTAHYFHWENPPLNALAISPDGGQLAVAVTAAARVVLFSLNTEADTKPQKWMELPVGLDPVSVRYRNNEELWVVNHISDSISVLNSKTGTIKTIIKVCNEPYDVVFAGQPQKAYVSCSLGNQLWVLNPEDFHESAQVTPLQGMEPRALSVSVDGRYVYVGFYLSGNASTLLQGNVKDQAKLTFPPNVVDDLDSPYGGANPPPADDGLKSNGPPVSLIVKKNAESQWLDDNGKNWTPWVSGDKAFKSGRVKGWTIVDHDLAKIDTHTGEVSYISGLMNVVMQVSVQPASEQVFVVGTDANNEQRFEPLLNGRFLRTLTASVNTKGQVFSQDLNPHLDYTQASSDKKTLSIGDPRSMVWSEDGKTAFVAGMGSDNIVQLDSLGRRVSQPLTVGRGPVSMAVANNHLYVLNRFDASISVISIQDMEQRHILHFDDPTLPSIQNGRAVFYNTHNSSGSGHISCASCHVDARTDGLVWDLGVPGAQDQLFDQNCITHLSKPCKDWAAQKGPMRTQTLVDIIGFEPFHWRGDRQGLKDFNPAFVTLMGNDRGLTEVELQQLSEFLSSIRYPPNPYRNPDNSLKNEIELSGEYRYFTTKARELLPSGNAVNGFRLFREGKHAAPFHCASCHTLPSGYGANQVLLSGGKRIPLSQHKENHLGVSSIQGFTNGSFKIPTLLGLYEHRGFDLGKQNNLSGFGLTHDGAVDALSRYLNHAGFRFEGQGGKTKQISDLIAFLLSFGSTDLPQGHEGLKNGRLLLPTGEGHGDGHSGIGTHILLENAEDLEEQLQYWSGIANHRAVDLILTQMSGDGPLVWTYQAENLCFFKQKNDCYSVSELMGEMDFQRGIQLTLVPSFRIRRH